jgi:hypothetical protein
MKSIYSFLPLTQPSPISSSTKKNKIHSRYRDRKSILVIMRMFNQITNQRIKQFEAIFAAPKGFYRF